MSRWQANAASGSAIPATPWGCDQWNVFLRCSLGQDRKGIASSLHALKNIPLVFSSHHGIKSAFL
jgi:hypothetical protein